MMKWFIHQRHITSVLSKTTNTRWDLLLQLRRCLILESKDLINNTRYTNIALISNMMRLKNKKSNLNCWRHPLSIKVILLRNKSIHLRKRKCLGLLKRHSSSSKIILMISRREATTYSKWWNAIISKQTITLCLQSNNRNTLTYMIWWMLS